MPVSQAMHPRLDQMVETGREAFAASGRDPQDFIVTVFAGLSEGWLRPDGRNRASLERVGVDRLILLVEPPFSSAAIEQAGQFLALH